MTNLRIESKKYTAPPVVQDLSNPIFKPVTTYRDPLYLKDLNIWLDNKKVDTSFIKYLEIIILPGREEVTANIKFTNLDYFIEGEKPEYWDNYLLKDYTKKDFAKYIEISSIDNLRKENSTKTIINGMPVVGDGFITDLSRGFDVEGYYSGLNSFVKKIVVRIQPTLPLEVEVTYPPKEFAININPKVTVNENLLN